MFQTQFDVNLSPILNSNSSELDPNDPDDQIDILQRYALNTLYFSTNGINWNSNELWTSENNPCGTTNNNGVENAWFGILCDSEQKVVEKVYNHVLFVIKLWIFFEFC